MSGTSRSSVFCTITSESELLAVLWGFYRRKCLHHLFLYTWLLTRIQHTDFHFYFFICFWLTTSMVWIVANIPLTFRFSGCSDCTFNLCTPTRPVILPGNEKLVLAPYHTYYPTLEEHLQGPWGIPIEPNLWNDPLVLGEKTFGDQCIKQSHNKRSVK